MRSIMSCGHQLWSQRRETRCGRSLLPMERRLLSSRTGWAFGTYGPATSGATIAIKSPLCMERLDALGGHRMGDISHSNFILASEARFTLPKFQEDSLIFSQLFQGLIISLQVGRVMGSGCISPRSEAQNPSRFGRCPFRADRQSELPRAVASLRSNRKTASSFIT